MSDKIAFIGIGNMGLPMAKNLMNAGKQVKVFDVSSSMIDKAKKENLSTVENIDSLIEKIFLLLSLCCRKEKTLKMFI